MNIRRNKKIALMSIFGASIMISPITLVVSCSKETTDWNVEMGNNETHLLFKVNPNNKEECYITGFFGGEEDKTLKIPEYITFNNIENHELYGKEFKVVGFLEAVFKDNNTLTNITIPETVSEIPNELFLPPRSFLCRSFAERARQQSHRGYFHRV